MMGTYTLHRLFEEQAARTPGALAVAAGEERLTYRELEGSANRLARRLRRLGVGPEVRVGLCVERRGGMVAALLGILKAGGAWVALDPAYPRERLARMMEDAGVEIVLAEPRTLGSLPAGAAGDSRVILLGSLESEERSEPLDVPVDPENLAYLVFTSGSTGRPKGVALTHRSTVALVRWARETFTPAELAGVLASTSLGFDLSVFEIFAPLSVGGTVIVAADALELPSLPADPPVTLLNTVPSAGAELLRGRGIPPSVQAACFAGEPLPASLAEGVYRTTAVRRVLNLYGPSEDTVYSTAACVEPGSPAPPIGRPIQGTRAHVDEEGELFLGGLGLARGYLGRPDATAERFVPDPWSGEPGARLYRTGDLIREGPGGELLFVGRADHQVKLRGFRIELGEIDAALLRHSAVREAVTVARDGSLAAYVALDEPAPGASELRSFLGRSLPEPMVPAVFHRLEALPRTLNGKVDRKALPQTAAMLPEEGGEVPPDLLAVLGALWAEALEMESVDSRADLFALGARAPQTSWVLARVRDLLGVALPERALSATPTVAGLARVVEARLDSAPEPPLGRAARDGALPLSLAQQRLWFLERVQPGEPTYNEPAALDLRGPVSVPRLAAALSQLVSRHEALRSRYGERGGEPFQETGPPVPVPLPVVDLGRFEEEAQRVADAEVRRPFDLGRPPHLRALLIRGEGRHVLVLTVHHIAYDGRSRIVLFEELDALYAGRPLPPPGLQPADFAAWERRAWSGVPAGQLAPVLGRLLESEPLGLPADRPRPDDPSSAGATLRFVLPPSHVARLRGQAREEGSSLFRLLLAAFAALLGRLAGQDHGTLGITAASRRAGIEDAVGFFINLLPLPLDTSGSPTLRGLLARSRETVDAVLALRDLPYQRLAAVRPGGDLFRVLFQMPRMPPLRLEGLEVAWRPVNTGTAKFDLETSLTEHGGALDGFCQYRTDLYDRASMAAFAARFLALLESVDPDIPLEDHPALREAERRQVAEIRRHRKQAAASATAKPATVAEELVAQIWSEVLGLESVGRRDNFFHLGGHSLLAARVLARVQETFGVRLPVRALFQAPTVETLADMVLAAEGTGGAPPPLLAVPGPGPHPVSFGQEALWLVSRMEPDGPLYNIPLAYRLRGELDRGALARSVCEAARRHEVLRARFVEIAGRLAQEAAVADLDVPWIDLSALPSAEPELARLLAEEADARFDLSRGPLARARLVILGEEEHVLQLTAHHAAFDGWSQGVLEREISQSYAATPSPAEGVLQYADFARWQRERLTSSLLDRLLAYWRAELAGAPSVLDLAADRPRPTVRRARGACIRCPLPAGLAAEIRALARAEGVTPFMVGLAAFQAQLHRATGQDDVLVGAPVASRHRPELEDLIGLFVDTVVLRGRIRGDDTFRELLARTRETSLAAFAHQELPLGRLVAELRPERGASHNPLFQAMFAFQGAPPEGLALGLESTPVDPGAATAMFDLTLTLEEDRAVALEYDRDLFDATTAESLLAGFLALLAGAVADPGRRISEIALAVPLPFEVRESRGGGSLLDRIASHVPEAVALILGEREVTYGELDRESELLAERMRGLGVGPETVVGVSLERSPELVVALLAVWKAGGAYLPVDPALPAERRAYLLEDSEARVVVEGAHSFPLTARALVPPSPEGSQGGEGSLAYLFYTSGSTGAPKPVGVTHAALADHVLAAADLLELSERDRALFFASPSFDVSLEELLPALVRGAAVVMRGPELWPPADFSAVAEGLGLTVADLPTAYWRQWVREARSAPPALRLVTVGGEAMPAEEARLWLQGPLVRVRLLNAYGPTEAVITATSHAVADIRSRVSLGRPLPGRRARVLDVYGQLQPAGVAGELCLGGTLARGYLKRPDLTAERFVPDPWSPEPGGRLYRTGDRARLLPDGTLEHLGRLDRQLKVRGVRIEPGEIEAALLRHPGVRETAVDLRPGPSGEPMLVAWIVAPSPISNLQSHLLTLLPEALVPAAFVPIPALPLTPAGKVDLRALPDPVVPTAAPSDAPRSPAEEVLAALWREVLGAEAGPDDSFFALGGHSLLAVRLLSRVREAFGVDLPVRALFAAPTLRGLAGAIAAIGSLGEGSLLLPIVAGPRCGLAPLSFPQQRLWFLDRLQPGSAIYNVPVALRLEGPLDPAALERSLDGLLRRHETLRTRFVEVDGQPWQEVLPPERFLLPEADLRALGPEARAAELARLGQEEVLRPFDLSRGPLLRALLVRLNEEEHALLLTLHHIVSDAWSDEILERELSALYAGRPLPALPVQYADYARWQRSWPEAFLAAQLEHWKGRLDGLPTLELPTDRPRPPVQTFRGGVVRFEVPGETASALRLLSRRRGSTLFMTLLAAWQAVLGHLAGQTDLAVGTPVANRGRSEIEGLVGFFVNMLALRADLSGDPAFDELLGRVRRTALDAYAHQELPFERIVDELRPERDLSRQPLVQVMIAYQDESAAFLELPGVAARPLDLALPIAKFDLTLSLAGGEDGLPALLEHGADLFDRTTVQRLAGHLVHFLEQVAANPEARLSEIGLLTPAERHQAALEWNDTAAPFAATSLIHQLFEARVDSRPGALAALWKGERITYGGLEERANRVAHLLREIGVGPGVSVGIWMERSLDMIAAVLGVLKAGGTYIPCDAAWPADRVEGILAATGSRAVLTRSALLPVVEDLQWRLPELDHAVCLDLPDPEPPPEPLDPEAVCALFDHVAERAVDRVTAGGFISGVTGLPFSEAEVDEYRDRVLALAEPWLRPGARVLEIGCGSGLLLWEMVKRGCRCTGLDPSPLTQERNREHARRNGFEVDLLTGFAHEIGGLAGNFDLVLLASTVQFFPGRRYLGRVLDEALAKLAPGGAVLVADVPDPGRESGKVLSVAEEWFRGLAAEVSVFRREEGFENELKWRYDVLLEAPSPALPRFAGEGERGKHVWTSWHVERCPAGRLPVLASPESVAYVIHTSGSTGRPKGIAVQHRPVANLIDWLAPVLGVGPDDRVLFVTSLAFDLSVWDLFGMLAAGGSIHVASEEDLRDPEELVRVLRREPVTIWDSAPAALVQLAPLFPPEPEEGSRLRLVMLSGDWIPVTLPDRVRSAFPGARVVSLGGATEATVWSNWYPVAEVDPRWPSIPYGRPIANARYHVLDASFDPCPIGVPGDLHIGGIGGGCLCVGYAGQPDLTAASFLPDPFSAEPGARLYCTGDRVRAFPDGNLEFLGRADLQVKIRGFRIEPGEIEATLVRHPGVREAAVVVREDVPGDKRLVAYLVAKVDSEPTPVSDLQSHLRCTLPEPMIPSAFVLLDELPVTANGKLDRRALPAPRREGSGEAATTPAQERLLAIWCEVLGIDGIGIQDNFFDLGGHSLLATRLVARLREGFGVDVHLRTLFQAPTVASLAAVLETETSVSAEPPLVPVPRDGDLPLSASQLRQWFLVQLDPGDPAYTLPLSLELEGRLDPRMLQWALAEIVRRHEALRTVFPARGGRPTAVLKPVSISLPGVDLSGLPGALRDEEARRLEADDRPFDLARGPLLRLALLRLEEEKHRLLLAVHHIVFDGWSFGVFTRELAALYGGASLPELPIQYADYAAWQHEWLAGPAAEAQVDSWKARLGGVSRTLELPTDRPRPAVQSSRGALVPLDLPPGLGRDLRAYAAREGVTLFMAGLAAWSALLARHAGQDGFNVGTFVANRRREALERLLGLFVNTLALPVDLAGDPDWRGLLARVRESTLEAFEHQEIPFERLLEALDLERDLSRTPLFQALFGVQNFALPSCQSPDGLAFRPLSGAEHDRITGDVALWIWEEKDGGVSGWIKYAADVFDRATAIRLGRQLATLLAAAMADPGARLSALPLLGDGERHQLLSEWGTAMPARADEDRLTVPERIALQARRTPDATAVEMGDEWLTYEELVRRTDGLAAELRRRGAGPETIVGLAMERSPRQIVALLGILRSGAAYLPLDPALPPARLARLVEESGARLVVTSPAGAERLTGLRVEMLVPDDVSLSSEGEGPDLGNMAYVLFTSGSTGTPKGVVVEHGSLSRFVTTCLGLYGFAPGDRVLQFAPLSFDISVEEIFTCLVSGATLVLRDDEMIASPSHFLARCRDLGITVLDLPTAYGHEVAPALAAGHPLPPALRLLIIAGERALPGPLGDWLAAGGDRLTVLDTYGPTENTVVASACRLKEGAALTIGRPIRGVEILVLDADLGPVPPGVPGEVYLGGAGVCRDYLNRPDLTAERFLPAPGGERRYRTGDLARWLPDGRLDFVGRADDQVKIRGFRIEPGEIAAVLSGHPGVDEAVVVARSTPAGPRLAAYATGRIETTGLRAWLKERLPAYMVPPDLVILDALPLTPSGKVDRRALPAPEGPSRERAFEPPTSPVEELLVDLWKQLLGVEEVGLYDDFFDLGGHSLLAPQLLARIQETFQVDLPLRVLFEAPTVAQMSVLLEDALLAQVEELSDEEAASLLEAG